MALNLNALVTDAHVNAAVAGLRALGRGGVCNVAVAPSRRAAGLYSKFTKHRAITADSTADPAGFVRAIAALAGSRGPFVVYPGHEDAIEALVVAGHDLPEGVILPFPVGEPLAALRDKRRLAELAERAGLGAPATLGVGPAGSLDATAQRHPCVVKPARTRVGLPSAGIANGSARLGELLERFPAQETVIVQELLSGPLVSLTLVVDRDGRLVERFQQQALETWPRGGGLISLAVSVDPDEEMARRVAAMLSELGYFGLVQLDLIATPDGPVLIDANPRFYASLSLAHAAGVNLPLAWHAVAAGKSAQGPTAYRADVGYRWLEADLKDALLGNPRAVLRRQPGPGVGASWDRGDPIPSLLLAAGALGGAARNRLDREPLPGND